VGGSRPISGSIGTKPTRVTNGFFDTNVLVYLIASDARKAALSAELLAGGGVASVQVLNEFVSVAIRKQALDWDEVEDILTAFKAALRIEPMTLETQARAVQIARRYRLAIYDATILASAQLAGCETVFSEDMQDGQVIEGLTIRNPFARAPQ
jgi:predicted nucleic acid-binding protein